MAVKKQSPNIPFSGVGLGPEQRDFVNSVISGKGFTNPLEAKLRLMLSHTTKAITQLKVKGLFGNDIISQDYQDLFHLKLLNLELSIITYWKHSNKLSGVVDSEIPELGLYDTVYVTPAPPIVRKSVVVGSANGLKSIISSDKARVGCAANIADFYDRLMTSINYCTARSEMEKNTTCGFGSFASILGSAENLFNGFDRSVECGPGCCNPCTDLPCTGADSVCFGLSGMIDHILSVKNHIGGQQGIDAALALVYEYSLGIDRLTAEIYCMITSDDTEHCRESHYVDRFALGQRISNDLINNKTVSSVMNSFFGTVVK